MIRELRCRRRRRESSVLVVGDTRPNIFLRTQDAEKCSGIVTILCVFVFQPIFTMSAQQSQLKVMDQPKFNKFIKAFSKDTVSKCLESVSMNTCHIDQLTVVTLFIHHFAMASAGGQDFLGVISHTQQVPGHWPL